MAPYIPPNRKRFVVPKKVLDKAAKAPPLPKSVFPFEELPLDILVYLFSNHLSLTDLICLSLTSRRFLHLLISIDSEMIPILHYQAPKASNPKPSDPIEHKNIPNGLESLSSSLTPVLESVDSPLQPVQPVLNPVHDPSPFIIPILRRLQFHGLLSPQKIACYGCCRVRRLGTKSYWADICEEIYCEKTWRRRRNDRTWADRRVIDYEFHEFSAAFSWAWKMWKIHNPLQTTPYRFFEAGEGAYEIQERPTHANGRWNNTSVNNSSKERELHKPICPECWAVVEAKKINARPPLRHGLI